MARGPPKASTCYVMVYAAMPSRSASASRLRLIRLSSCAAALASHKVRTACLCNPGLDKVDCLEDVAETICDPVKRHRSDLAPQPPAGPDAGSARQRHRRPNRQMPLRE